MHYESGNWGKIGEKFEWFSYGEIVVFTFYFSCGYSKLFQSTLEVSGGVSTVVPSLQLQGTGKTAAVQLVGKSCLSVCLSALGLAISPERVVRSTSFLACGRGPPGPRTCAVRSTA